MTSLYIAMLSAKLVQVGIYAIPQFSIWGIYGVLFGRWVFIFLKYSGKHGKEIFA
jgi:hypothetical protein